MAGPHRRGGCRRRFQAPRRRFKRARSAVTYAAEDRDRAGREGLRDPRPQACSRPPANTLYRRALALVVEAGDLEQAARKPSAGWEENQLAAEVLFRRSAAGGPSALCRGAADADRGDRIGVGGTAEALLGGQADGGDAPHPPGLVRRCSITPLLAVAAPDHPLHQLGARAGREGLATVAPPAGEGQARCATGVPPPWRWSSAGPSAACRGRRRTCAGYGFAWYPDSHPARASGDGRPAAPGGAEPRQTL